MAFAWILPASQEWLGPVPDDATVHDADRAAAQLRADYERWSRWGLGVGAFVVAVLGLFVSGGMVAVIADVGWFGPIDVVIVLVGVALAVGGLLVLHRLRRTGRVLSAAAAAWLRMPCARGLRDRSMAGWVGARTINLEPRILARVTTGVLALIVALFGLAAPFSPAFAGMIIVSATFLGIGLLGLACGCCQFGGVLRLVSGVAERDPLWVRLRDG
ncbi:MAG: hypothetical protein WBP61_13680 [Nocardioides sp.]